MGYASFTCLTLVQYGSPAFPRLTFPHFGRSRLHLAGPSITQTLAKVTRSGWFWYFPARSS